MSDKSPSLLPNEPPSSFPENDNNDQPEQSLVGQSSENKDPESLLTFVVQSLIPLLLAGIGLIGTGLLLHKWQNEIFFRQVHEAMMLSPALLGLKGNLEMTLASRMATISHLGKLDSTAERLKIFGVNLALVQCQAIVVSLFATIITVVTDVVRCHSFQSFDALLLASAAVTGTCLSAVVLGFLIMSMLMVSQKLKFNPDNVVTPLTASLGDLVTFLFFIGSGTLYLTICKDRYCWISSAVLTAAGLLLPLWIYLAYKSPHTRPTLQWGWFSIAFAATISCGGGYILELAVEQFENISLFQPLLAGLAGNRAAVQCSRLCSWFFIHFKTPGEVPPEDSYWRRINPWYTFSCGDIHSKTAVVLVLTAIPYQFLFFSLTVAVDGSWLLFNYKLIGFYMIAAFIQVILLMYITQLVVYVLWRLKTDPDHSSIPILTSLSDLMGSGFIYIVFKVLHSMDPTAIGITQDFPISSNSTFNCST
uniref:SLC41A/MgtE integral membrane domain-containing protein n=1 Tax=Panagrolaimus sp. JU765 TaxID=591449 RepID=A0AC34QS84_9BILA